MVMVNYPTSILGIAGLILQKMLFFQFVQAKEATVFLLIGFCDRSRWPIDKNEESEAACLTGRLKDLPAFDQYLSLKDRKSRQLNPENRLLLACQQGFLPFSANLHSPLQKSLVLNVLCSFTS